MANLRLKAFTAGLALTAIMAVPASAVTSKAACEYEGGETFNIGADLVCVVPIRDEEFHGEEYDDKQLGVKTCEGTLIGDDVFCRITLVKGKVATPAAAADMTPAAQGSVQSGSQGETSMQSQAVDMAKDELVKEGKKQVRKRAKDAIK